MALERDPYSYSTAFGSSDQRVIESEDFRDGLIMSAFIRVDRNRLDAKIMWVELRPIANEDDGDDLTDNAP